MLDGIMVFPLLPLSEAWRQEPSLAPRLQRRGHTTLTRTTPSPSISGRDATSGANASGTAGDGAFAASRIVTDAFGSSHGSGREGLVSGRVGRPAMPGLSSLSPSCCRMSWATDGPQPDQ